MEKVQTNIQEEDKEQARMSNGLQLVSLICNSINSLRLTRSQVMQWTNNIDRLRAWVRLLVTDWVPTETTIIQKHKSRMICTLSEVKLNQGYNPSEIIETAAAWIEPWNHRESPFSVACDAYKLTEKEARMLRSEPTPAFRCTIVEELDWYISFFRSVFRFEGNDKILVKAFLSRDVVWSVDSVLSLIARIIHNPQDDQLDLQRSHCDFWFPVYTGPVSIDNSFDLESARENIKFMSVRQSSERHLGRTKWRYRILYSLKDILNGKAGIGDKVIDAGDVIFFKNSPLPREKKSGYQDWNPALHSK